MKLSAAASVVIPSAGRPQLLARLLSVLLIQTHGVFEVIIGLNAPNSWNADCDVATEAVGGELQNRVSLRSLASGKGGTQRNFVQVREAKR